MTIYAAGIPESSFLGLDSIVDSPHESPMSHASTVHDQNRSEIPKTPQVWKSDRTAWSSVVAHLFSFLLSWLLISMTPDAVSYH
jgi:hypothetical protein